MKLAFSTLGMPGLPVPEAVRLAVEHGYQGVELRTHPEEPVHLGLTLAERADTAGEFTTAGIRILALAGDVRVAAEGEDEPVLAELAASVELARDLGAPYVRVLAGGDGQDPAQADATAARRLGAAAPHAAVMGVRILLETHDSHPRGADVARVVGTVGHRQIGAVWDLTHTWSAGEEPAAGHAVLAPHLGYVRVKGIVPAEDTRPPAAGTGVLPLRACLDTLDPDSWVCWEYGQRRHPDATELPGRPELLGAAREHLLRLGAPKQ